MRAPGGPYGLEAIGRLRRRPRAKPYALQAFGLRGPGGPTPEEWAVSAAGPFAEGNLGQTSWLGPPAGPKGKALWAFKIIDQKN